MKGKKERKKQWREEFDRRRNDRGVDSKNQADEFEEATMNKDQRDEFEKSNMGEN